MPFAADFVQRIVTFAQLDGIAAFGGLHRLANAPIRLLCCRTDAFLRVIAGCCINIDRFCGGGRSVLLGKGRGGQKPEHQHKCHQR